jgi:alkylation response protein AidB-like acyl-CoA dehydrogenase
MEFRDPPEIAAFRQEVRDWIVNDLSDDERGIGRNQMGEDGAWERMMSVRRKLAAKGWTAPAWPKEYGGMGATIRQQAVFNEELAYHRVSGPDFIGVNYVGPTVMLFGTPEQKSEYIPRILAGEDRWCQGYSEPGAGSDLASLQTRAVIEGDNFVINGQKIWTSGAHRASHMFMLVRTDPDAPKHRGISYLLLEMDTPGITVRPLVNMTGGHEFNEVFFEDVVVPRGNLVGELNRGWYVGMATLDFERSAIGGVAGTQRDLEELIDQLKERQIAIDATGKAMLSDRFIEGNVARWLSMRIISMQDAGLVPNYEASSNKMFTTELNQRIARTAMKLLGMSGQVRDEDERWKLQARWAFSYLRTVANTIEGGSSEIQRNIVATRGLGLPRG